MATPTGSISFNKSSYRPGETVIATVSYSDSDSSTGSARFTFTDSGGNNSSVVATFTISDPVTVTSGPGNDRTWTKVNGSDTGSSVQFTATA